MEEKTEGVEIDDEIPESGKKSWKRIKIDVNEIELDNENPRLNLSNNATKTEIISALFEESKIDGLINSILEKKGLFPGEDIIVIKESDKYKVIEGNRRVCSLQCILNAEFIPKEKREEIKEMIKNSETKPEDLKEVEVVISPSRDDAQIIITARHTKYQIEKWNYVPKWRRDYNAFKKLNSIEAVCKYLGEDYEDVKKYLRNYSFLQYVLQMTCWTKSEREILSKNDLEGSLIEWHMHAILDIFIIKFTEEFELKTEIPNKKLDFVLENLIRSFYLNGKPKINTRTDKQTFRGTLNEWMKEWDNKNKDNGNNPKGEPTNGERKTSNEDGDSKIKTPPKNNPKDINKKGRKPEKYFSSLYKSITVDDNRLIRLTYELSKNDMKDRPATGVLLARSLIESSLLYRIDKWGLTQALRNENKKKSPEEIRMNRVIQFCINHVQELFSDSNNARISLQKIQSEHLNYMNSIVHNSWQDPSAGEVEKIAGNARELLRTILTKSQ